MRRALPLAFAAGIALFIAAPVHAEPVTTLVADVVDSADVQRDGERFRHVGSSYVFPSSLGDMPARKVTVFGPGDVSVQYTVDGGAAGDAWVDLYAYPANGESIAQTAADVVAAITNTFAATPALMPAGMAVRADGLHSGWFDGRLGERSLKTGYYVVKRGEWLIKIRATMPSPPTPETLARTAAAIGAVQLGALPAAR
ncbi:MULTISPECIES: hypothetical protein [unclassified Sphingopyxis]|uniref:hypothetical protein n=1 Tax=unclassified Sphingopyxis TaxID=2614943 RepID=UPI0028658A29|nr:MULTISPECIES: hypothetical protein [unclassified Sphingopyxis]MDR6832989.1 hypothetical protein [Sphingopyxis sp. BE122]MDR7228732.1 hypothetical protein [Sphingopyxis sp. BE259]